MQQFFRSLDLDVRVIGPRTDSYLRLEDDARAEADSLMSAFTDPAVDAVVCAMGGNTAVRIAPYLDYLEISRNPKVFQGSSDITVLHQAITTRSRLVTFYGANGLYSLGESTVHPWTREQLQRAWFSDAPYALTPAPEWTDERYPITTEDDGVRDPARHFLLSSGWDVLVPGSACGTLDGGCLETLAWHHPFSPASHEPRIVHLDIANPGDLLVGRFSGGPEDVSEWLGSLVARGFFEGAVAIMFSRPRAYLPEQREALRGSILRSVGHLRIPVVTNVDVGHTDPIGTIPLGLAACLDVSAQSLTATEPPTVSRVVP